MILCKRLFVLFVLLFGAFSQNALAQFGRVTGKIAEAGTGFALPGANVFIAGTSIGAASDNDGHYLLSKVPFGSYTLKVAYLGYETQSVEINVRTGDEVVQNFDMEEMTMTTEEVVVLGTRAKGQAKALNQQLNAVNITNVVASDQIGRFPDASAPDALQRLPGITTTRDQGESRFIQIRGASAAMTSVTFNGERIPSPEGDVRQIALDAVPVDVLESIEVSKAITPDMDADAIGGSVNLVTRRAPDQPILSVEGAPGYGSIREEFSGKGSFTYGNRFLDGKVGFLAGGSLSDRRFGSDNIEPTYDFNDTKATGDDVLEELEVRYYSLSRQRSGLTGVLDYRFSENSNLYLSGVWTELQDDEIRRRLINTVEDDELGFRHKTRLEKLRSWNTTFGGDHLFSNDSQLDFHFTITQSEEKTPHDIEIEFLQEDVTFQPNLSDFDEPQANPQNGALNGDFVFDNVQPASSITQNKDIVAALNYSLPYRLGDAMTGKFKAGGKFRKKNKDQDSRETAYELADGASDILLNSFNTSFSNNNFNPGTYPLPSILPSDKQVRDFQKNFSNSLAEDPDVEADYVEDFKAEEKTFALYGMTEINFTPELLVLAGARFERTELDNEGYEFVADDETLSPSKGSNSYNDIFPMAHLRYRFSENTNLRAAVTTALLRPNFYDLAPYKISDGEDAEIGNPELDPATSVNLDLLFEHYFRPLGVVSAGVFYKSIKDPIYRSVFDNDLGGETEQPINGEDAEIFGVEVAAQQQLRFLPKPLDGLGLYGNYTYTSSETTLPGGRKVDLPGQTKNVFNLALGYEKGPFSGQLSMNFHDQFVEEIGGDTFDDRIVQEHLQFDLSTSLRLTRQVSVFLEWVNMNNEPWVVYQATKDRPVQKEFYESWTWFGLKFNM